MANNFTANPGAGGDTFAADDVGGVKYPFSKIDIGASGASSPVTAANPLPVTGNVGITGSVPVTGTFFQATQPVSGTFWQATQPVSVADGSDGATGAKADAAASSDTGTFSLIALIKRMLTKMPSVGQALMAASQPVAIASDQSQIPVIQGAAATQTYNVAGIITINTVLLTIDLSQYRGASIQCTSMGTTGVVTPEWSNDNSNWIAATIFTPPGASATTFNAAGLWNAPKQARYLRLRLSTATTAGTTTIFTEAYSDRPQAWLATQPVSGTVTATVASTTITSISAGTNAIGDVGVQYRASATGGATPVLISSPATPAAQVIKAGAGRFLTVLCANTNAAARYLKVYNVAAASVVMGTTAAILDIPLPPSGALVNWKLEGGFAFSTAMSMAVTGGKGATDNTAITLNDVSGVVGFA